MAPRLDPRIHVLKSYRSKDENIPLSQSNYKWGWSYPQIAMHTYTPCGLIVNKPWVSHSRLWFSHSHCAHIITTGSNMLSIVDTWGCIQHFFKVLISHITIGSCSVSLTRMHWHLVPPPKKCKVTLRTTMHWYTTSTRQGNLFSQQGFVSNCLMMACLIATDDVYIHHQCHQSISP